MVIFHVAPTWVSFVKWHFYNGLLDSRHFQEGHYRVSEWQAPSASGPLREATSEVTAHKAVPLLVAPVCCPPPPAPLMSLPPPPPDIYLTGGLFKACYTCIEARWPWHLCFKSEKISWTPPFPPNSFSDRLLHIEILHGKSVVALFLKETKLS
jgi:hypothetical protein